MNDDLVSVLRDGIDRLTAGSTIPADMAGRARQAMRRRHWLRTAAVGGTVVAATAVAAGIGVAALPTRPDARAAPTAAYLVDMIGRAMAETGADAPVLYVRTIPGSSGATLPGELAPLLMFVGPNSPIAALQSWTHGDVSRADIVGVSGTTDFAERNVTKGQVTTALGVDYRARTWWRIPAISIVGEPPDGRGCAALQLGDSLAPLTTTPGQLGNQIRRALTCGVLKVTGRQRVDGVDAIRLSFLERVRLLRPPDAPIGTVVHDLLWVDPATYRPVRLTASIGSLGSPLALWYRDDFRWLPPNPANLALLELSVPGGFRRVPSPLDHVVRGGRS